MQFKHPELLWALFLLLIPILIHLFQLRRFKKTPFTNVKLLQKVVAESRRSSTLKKWLLLVTRLLLLGALVVAFAQPFFAEKSALQKDEMVVYLDNSFSMEAKSENRSLLTTAIQELIQTAPKDKLFSLFTNDRVFRDISIKDIQNDLLTLGPTQKQLNWNEIILKSRTLFKDEKATLKNLIAISDFQQRMASDIPDSTQVIKKHLVQLKPEIIQNVTLDTAFISNTTPSIMELTTVLSGHEGLESIPVSLYNGDKLIAKTAAVFNSNNTSEVVFSLPVDEVINGRIEITEPGLEYDNHLYFNVNNNEKIKVLAIGDANDNFLKRIYTSDEFEFTSYKIGTLNYGRLETQNLIILNELITIPVALQNSIKSFVSNGGSVVVIPNQQSDFSSYNGFLANFFGTSLTQIVGIETPITNISFAHPIYRDVFESRVTNFQYPKASGYFRINTRASTALSFQGNDPFLIGNNGFYLFTAALDEENGNFKNSPLIVPTFYSIGINSLKLPNLYNVMEGTQTVDVPISLEEDNILEVVLNEIIFIPQQVSFANKTSLTFSDNPDKAGIYTVRKKETQIMNISFNYPRDESNLIYLNSENFDVENTETSIAGLFAQIEKDNSVTELWKWFVILALFFVLGEILIQKFF